MSIASYLKRALLFTLGFGAAVFFVGLLGESSSSTTQSIIAFGLTVIVVVAVIVVYLILFGLGVSLAKGHDISRKNRILAFATAPISLSLLIFSGLPILWSGIYVGALGKLMLNHSAYEEIVRRNATEIKGEPFQIRRTENGIEYVIDTGPPFRFAFEPDGFLDNWSGIVYDPSGDVLVADGFDGKGKFKAPDRVTKLFGGDLVSCSQLIGYYYRCGFT
jgi:hypothetical protein